MSAELSRSHYEEAALSLPPNHPFAEIDRLVVLRRPGYTPAKAAVHAALGQPDLLKQVLGITDIQEIDTAPDLAGMVRTMRQIRPTDGLVVVGGDGTASNANGAALELGHTGPILHRPGGNKCDQGHMLFTRSTFGGDVLPALAVGRLADVQPLQAVATNATNGKTRRTMVWGYFSVGEKLPAVAAGVNSPAFRARVEGKRGLTKFREEATLTLGVLATGGRIRLSDEKGERQLSDVIFANGGRMAGYWLFSRIHLLQPGIGRIELPSHHLPVVGATVLKAVLGGARQIPAGTTYEFTARAQNAPLLGQRDGETEAYGTGTTAFTVGPHDGFVSLVTTR